MKLKKYILYGAIISFIMGLYAFHFSDIPPFRTDEGLFYDGARQVMLGQSISVPSYENGQFQSQAYFGHPPLQFLLLGSWFSLFGDSIISARVFSLFISFLSVLVMVMVMRLFSLPRNHIILLILLVLTNPLFYVMAKTIRPENFMLLGVGLAIYFYLKWRKTLQNRWIALSGLCIATTSLAHYYIFFMGIFWLIILLRSRKLSSFLIFIGSGIIVYVPYIAWLFQNWNIAIMQFLARRPLIPTPISLKFYDLFVTSFNIRSIPIVFLLIVGFIILGKNKKMKQTAWLYWITLLFYTQFLLLPIFNPLHTLSLIMIVVGQYCYILSEKKNIYFTQIFLICIIFFHTLGTVYFIQGLIDWSYEKYTKTMHSQNFYHKNQSIIGPSYLIEAFKDTSFIAWNTYSNGFVRHYSSDMPLIQQLKRSNIVLIDYHTINPNKKIQRFLNTHALEIKTIYNGEYGYWPLTLYRMKHSETKNE